MHRLFVAIRPPLPVRAHLLAMMGGFVGARWQDDAQLHLTLRFIGEVDGAVAQDVATALATIRHPPLDLTLAGIGHFERKGRLDSLWAGVAPRPAINHLHEKIDQALVRVGLAPETRAYLPHITLARFGRTSGAPGPFIAAHGALSGPAFRVTDFGLYQSHLGSGGSLYEVIERYPLG